MEKIYSIEEKYGDLYRDRPLEERFFRLFELAYNQTAHRCVVLIDEYDKPKKVI